MNSCWILIGMMGAGKSSVGRALAELSGREFLDTDLAVQNRLGRPIPQIFQIYGESTFRDHETSVLRSISGSDLVLATGGGIVLRDENWTEFKRLGTTIYLKADTETLADRLSKSKKRRPLLECEGWEQRMRDIMDQRLELYERADVTVSVDNLEVEAVALRIIEAVKAT
jgi:shikimate kinase